jgi:hypothetical protein
MTPRVRSISIVAVSNLRQCRLTLWVTTVDCGDYVVCTNARHAPLTGKKAEQKVYRYHTMYPGGLKEIPFARMRERKPDEVRVFPVHSAGLQLTWRRSHSRSFARPCRACCPRTSSEHGDWNGYSSFPTPSIRTPRTSLAITTGSRWSLRSML